MYFAALHRVDVIIVIFKSVVLINLNGYFHLEIVNIVLSYFKANRIKKRK